MNKTINIATFYRALANKNRLRIIKVLENCSLCVCEIKEVLGTTQPAVSRHLSILKQAGFLEGTKKAGWVYYGISRTKNPLIKQLLAQIFNALETEKQSAKDRRKVKKLLKTKLCKQEKANGKKRTFTS